MEIYSVNLHIQSKCGKIRTRITPNTNTFYAVNILSINFVYFEGLIIELHRVTVRSCWLFSASWVIFFIIDFCHGLEWCRKILPMSVNDVNEDERLFHTSKGRWRRFKPKSVVKHLRWILFFVNVAGLGFGKIFQNIYLTKHLWATISVGNKAKERISKRVFQKQSTSNFPKNEHFLHPDMHT